MTKNELKEWRAAAGVTQTGMAQRLGVSLRTYQELEAGDEQLLPTTYQIAVDMASMILALESRDASKLTRTAMGVYAALEGFVTEEDKARYFFNDILVLSPVEDMARKATEKALGRELTREECVRFVKELRESNALNNDFMDDAPRAEFQRQVTS